MSMTGARRLRSYAIALWDSQPHHDVLPFPLFGPLASSVALKASYAGAPAAAAAERRASGAGAGGGSGTGGSECVLRVLVSRAENLPLVIG
mgnify:CR=1 FL=1